MADEARVGYAQGVARWSTFFSHYELKFGPKWAYNADMARGWESKAVEAQIESKSADFVSTSKPTRTPDQIHHLIEKRNLELARAKVQHELESSQNPRYSQMLTRALSELDAKISSFH